MLVILYRGEQFFFFDDVFKAAKFMESLPLDGEFFRDFESRWVRIGLGTQDQQSILYLMRDFWQEKGIKTRFINSDVEGQKSCSLEIYIEVPVYKDAETENA